jgi:hypothetical protein
MLPITTQRHYGIRRNASNGPFNLLIFQGKLWSGRGDSNPRPQPWQRSILRHAGAANRRPPHPLSPLLRTRRSNGRLTKSPNRWVRSSRSLASNSPACTLPGRHSARGAPIPWRHRTAVMDPVKEHTSGVHGTIDHFPTGGRWRPWIKVGAIALGSLLPPVRANCLPSLACALPRTMPISASHKPRCGRLHRFRALGS